MKMLMRQAQEMQKKMQKAQEELATAEYEGSSGGGMVKAVIGGNFEAKKIEVDQSLIDDGDKEIIEDLIVAAFNDAKKKAENGSSEAMKSATGGMGLPAGFKL